MDCSSRVRQQFAVVVVSLVVVAVVVIVASIGVVVICRVSCVDV